MREPGEESLVWRACVDCGWHGTEFRFYSPSSVYCEGCDTKVGETNADVEWDLAGLSGGVVKHPDSDDVLATVNWFDDRVVEL